MRKCVLNSQVVAATADRNAMETEAGADRATAIVPKAHPEDVGLVMAISAQEDHATVIDVKAAAMPALALVAALWIAS